MIDLIQSKKFLALVIGIALMIVSDLTGVSVETILAEATSIIAYLTAQGLADNGKEKAKIEKFANYIAQTKNGG